MAEMSAESVPPTKNSSGFGFAFETKVVATCLLDLLTEQGSDGKSSRRLEVVCAQTRPKGWLCDDVLLVYATSDGDRILVPTSIKSLSVLSTSSARSEFVGSAWGDFLGEKRFPRPFRKGHDRIGLFSAPNDPETTYVVGQLVTKAREQTTGFRRSVTLPGHLAHAEEWLSNLACPPGLSNAGGSTDADTDLQSFIASLDLRTFDFESPSSHSTLR